MTAWPDLVSLPCCRVGRRPHPRVERSAFAPRGPWRAGRAALRIPRALRLASWRTAHLDAHLAGMWCGRRAM